MGQGLTLSCGSGGGPNETQHEMIGTWLLGRSMKPDVLNRNKQILMFDSLRGRTCLHFAACYGHSDCLQAILSSARTSHVALSWGFARFVNIRDGKGETPLHLAARQRWADCVHILLDKGALVCASSGGYGCSGITFHVAARGGSLDCIRELLAWGADRLQRDTSGRIPYVVAMKHKHDACAALLNPLSAEPLVWPSPLKFISELNPDAKLLLERALSEANRERGRKASYSIESPSQSDSCDDDDTISEGSDTKLCCICFDQVCTIEVRDCEHRMCAHCTRAPCCHNKPNPTTASTNPPVCPFCRSNISHLVVKLNGEVDDIDNSSSKLRITKRSWNCEGSSSFKGLSTFGKMGGRGSWRISLDELMDKPSE